jgi:hypothetical protein
VPLGRRANSALVGSSRCREAAGPARQSEGEEAQADQEGDDDDDHESDGETALGDRLPEAHRHANGEEQNRREQQAAPARIEDSFHDLLLAPSRLNARTTGVTLPGG